MKIKSKIITILMLVMLLSTTFFVVSAKEINNNPIQDRMRRPPCWHFGDIDNDGFVTPTDAKLVLSYYLGRVKLNKMQQLRVDVNADGSVGLGDFFLILHYLKIFYQYL